MRLRCLNKIKSYRPAQCKVHGNHPNHYATRKYKLYLLCLLMGSLTPKIMLTCSLSKLQVNKAFLFKGAK